MKAPYYEYEKDEQTADVAEWILSDKRPVHFVRRRNIFPEWGMDLTLSDSRARSMFDDSRAKDIHSLNMHFARLSRVYPLGWGRYFIVFQPIFILLLGVLIYYAVSGILTNATAEQIPVVILVGCLCVITGGISVWLTVNYFRKYLFLKKAFFKMDDLYVIFDGERMPFCVECRGKRIRVLYRDTLYIIVKNKIKVKKSPLTLYCSYLNMYPPSALDIGHFVPEHKPALTEKYLRPSEALIVNAAPWGQGYYLSMSTNGKICKYWRIYKYLFELNEDIETKVIYSAATESMRFRYYYITRAEAVERGEAVEEYLKFLAQENKQFAKIFYGCGVLT